MQYLLSEEEMAVIRKDRESLRESLRKMPTREDLVNVVQHVACNMIMGDRPASPPHGCIHVRNPIANMQTLYCDHCPVSGICPQGKDWSK